MKQVYGRGNYAKLENFWRGTKKGIVTRSEMIAYGQSIGMSESEAAASTTVILSPRESSERGDCRGNLSAQGHLYFAEPLARETGEEGRFRFRTRVTALERRVRTAKPAAKAKTVKAKAKKAAKPAKPAAKPAKTVKAKSPRKAKVAAPAPAVEATSTPAPAAAVETPETTAVTPETPAS